MRASLCLQPELEDAIDAEVAQRIRQHQRTIARLKGGKKIRETLAPGAAAGPEPLVMLAHGDSWFDYPLTGNGLPLEETDIIAQLACMGVINPVILNVSHFGNAAAAGMSLPKQERLRDVLLDPNNWMESGKPDAILFSGGGDDIAGEQFCIFLDYNVPGSSGLDLERFQGALDMVEASYKDLFLFRDRFAPGVPIFAHCYDFPIPNGVHPGCAGPWLKPSLDFCGWNVTQGTAIVRQALIAFKAMLAQLAAKPVTNFTLVDTQGVLQPSDWANELHPKPPGFNALAQKFVTALRAQFPKRI